MKSTEHISVRIPSRLYEMIRNLIPLFDMEFSSALIHILKNYEYSEDHTNQLNKLERMRFEIMFRDANLKKKLEELKPEEMFAVIEELKEKRKKNPIK